MKSSTFRILYTLKEMGYVQQGGVNGIYHLSPKLAALSRGTVSEPVFLEIVRPHLSRLRNEVWESVWLAQLRHGTVILVEVVEASHVLRLRYDIGDRCPWHATSLGKAIAAYLSPAELKFVLGDKRLPRFTRRTITRRSGLRAELVRARRDGLAVNNEETTEGAIIFGAPLFDSLGKAFAAVSVSVPTVRCSSPRRKAIIASLKKAGAALTAELARPRYRAPEPETTIGKLEIEHRKGIAVAG